MVGNTTQLVGSCMDGQLLNCRGGKYRWSSQQSVEMLTKFHVSNVLRLFLRALC